MHVEEHGHVGALYLAAQASAAQAEYSGALVTCCGVDCSVSGGLASGNRASSSLQMSYIRRKDETV